MKPTTRLLAALLSLALPAWGAMNFNGSTEWAESSTVEISATPLTICARGVATSATANNNAVSISFANPTNTRLFALNWRGADAGDPIIAQQVGDTTNASASTSTGYSAGVWHHGCAVLTSNSSRAALIDGASKGTNTTDTGASTGVNRTSVATVWLAAARGAAFGGGLANVGFWSVALTDENVASLAKGYASHCIRPDQLAGDYPMVRDTTSLKDHAGSPNHLTLTGGTVSNHPRTTNCQ